ncbi:hypothetical protein FOZ61_010035 [Perkinsus olseni]|uniref:Uncharacterized protein n=1 Tax=Perkinsus olseni TaxID=32597 RepID=A0A7J6M3U0_PEROL|nr:hypothetical protein FOZ61_010035 [Perkinsus olseni]
MISDEASDEAGLTIDAVPGKTLAAGAAASSSSSNSAARPLMPNRRFMRYSASTAVNNTNRLSNIPVKRYTDKSVEIQTGLSSIGSKSRRLSECIMGQELATPRVHDFHVDECLAPKKGHVSLVSDKIGLLASPADLASRFDDTLNRMTPVSEVKKAGAEEGLEEENSPPEATTLAAKADELLGQFALPPTRRHFSRYSATMHPSAAIRKTNEAVARTARRKSAAHLGGGVGAAHSPSAINQDVIDGVELVSEPASSSPAPTGEACEGPLAGTPTPDKAVTKMKSPPTFKRRRSARLSGSGKRSRVCEDQTS